MTNSEKSKIEAEKAARIYIHNECSMVKGIIDRMFQIDDLESLNTAYESARKRIDKIYGYHLERVKELQKINGGTERCAQ